MEEDALKGRVFEDIVAEYDVSYRPTKPLKVFGGQHRVTAIRKANEANIHHSHGVRIYFSLEREQKYDIANANNTAIDVPPELLDRMGEELLGTDLRDWCQDVGLLPANTNFADRRSSEGIPTVRIARTLLVNFYLGKKSNKSDEHRPKVCTSGPKIDDEYLLVRKQVNWQDKSLRQMGAMYALLHNTQRQRVMDRTQDNPSEFVNKAMHPAIVAGWSYAAGYFQTDKVALATHYELPNKVGPPSDPLNAKALVSARLKAVDPDTYRGIGSRMGPEELGRVLEVFFLHANKTSKGGITLKLANAAIISFVAKKAQIDRAKAVKNL